MEQIKGTQLGKWPLNDLSKIDDLIYFEGSLLSNFKNDGGDNYLFYWCDSDESYNRWLVFRVIEKQLQNYFDKKTSLRELMLELSDGFLYSVDIDDELQYRNIYMMVSQDLPESYLPSPDSYYDFELSLVDTQEQENQRNCAIGIDPRWALQSLPQFLRNEN